MTKKPEYVARDLGRETAATAALKDQLRAILGDEPDAEILASTAEGETNLFETIDAVLGQIGIDQANIAGIKEFSESLSARKARLEKRVEFMRTSLANALEVLEQKKFERPLATLTLKDVPPKLIVTDEAAIPSTWWKPSDPTLDRKGLTDALKARQKSIDDAMKAAQDDAAERAAILASYPAIPGTELSNGSITVQVRFS